jgi:hypothetical protein
MRVFLRLVMLGAFGLTSTWAGRAIADEASAFEAAKKQPAMEFFVAWGAPDACGVGCDHWIAAEGRIVDERKGPDGCLEESTTDRLVNLLAGLGDRKLPIFFHSPGGEIMESLALGRLLRARGLSAGVATTLPANCSADSVEECRKLMRERPEAEARLWSEGVTCASACAYAILGAVTREIAVGARVGVHSSLVDPSASETQRARTAAAGERGIMSYLADLGIDAELYRIAMSSGFESVHVLTRAELYDLGIDPRETVSSGWILGNVDARKGFFVFDTAVMKTAGDSRDNLATTFKQLSLIVGCYRPRRNYLLGISRPLPDGAVKSKSDFRVSTGAVGLTLDGGTSVLASLNKATVQQWREPVRRGVLEALLTSPAIRISELQPRDKRRTATAGNSPPEFLLSNVRGGQALKAIVSRCADQR